MKSQTNESFHGTTRTSEIIRSVNDRLLGDKSDEGEVRGETLTIMSDITVSEMGPLEPGPARTPCCQRTEWHVTVVVSKNWLVLRGILAHE